MRRIERFASLSLKLLKIAGLDDIRLSKPCDKIVGRRAGLVSRRGLTMVVTRLRTISFIPLLNRKHRLPASQSNSPRIWILIRLI